MKKFFTLILSLFMFTALMANANTTSEKQTNKFKPKIEHCQNLAVVSATVNVAYLSSSNAVLNISTYTFVKSYNYAFADIKTAQLYNYRYNYNLINNKANLNDKIQIKHLRNSGIQYFKQFYRPRKSNFHKHSYINLS